MIKNKLKLYYKDIIKLFFIYLYGKVLIPKKINSLLIKKKIKISSIKSFKNNYYSIYKIKNARVFTDNNENVAVIKNNFILPSVSFQQVNGKLLNTKFNSVVKNGTPSFIRKINGKVFNLCQGGSGNNYFHFIFDILPKIYLLKSVIKLNQIDYFYLVNPKPWQVQILNLLGINSKKLLNSLIYKHIIVDELYAVDHPWYKSGFFQYEVQKIPEWLVKKNRENFLKRSNKKIKNKIFLDRSESKFNHCQIENIKNIKDLLISENFKFYKPETFTFKKQIQLFQNSSIVIGAHGAAFTNIIFCSPGTKIIELIPKDHPNKKCKRISKILNLKYYRIETVPDNSDPNYPFKIQLSKKNLEVIKKIISL